MVCRQFLQLMAVDAWLKISLYSAICDIDHKDNNPMQSLAVMWIPQRSFTLKEQL